MKKPKSYKQNRIYFNVFLFLCIFIINTIPVYANETQVNLSVEQEVITSSNKQDIIVEYELSCLETNTPMPSGSVGDIYSFFLQGDNIKIIDSITYTTAGIYRYQLKQISTNKQSECTIDDTVYIIAVYVGIKEDNSLEAKIIIESGDYKTNIIKFSNYYNIDETEYPSTDTNTDQSNTQSTNDKNTNVNTGDENNLLTLVIALILALSVVGIILIIRRNKK